MYIRPPRSCRPPPRVNVRQIEANRISEEADRRISYANRPGRMGIADRQKQPLGASEFSLGGFCLRRRAPLYV